MNVFILFLPLIIFDKHSNHFYWQKKIKSNLKNIKFVSSLIDGPLSQSISFEGDFGQNFFFQITLNITKLSCNLKFDQLNFRNILVLKGIRYLWRLFVLINQEPFRNLRLSEITAKHQRMKFLAVIINIKMGCLYLQTY